jgi:C1A family cysteine protease
MTEPRQGYGWKPSLPDPRDVFAFTPADLEAIAGEKYPDEFSLRAELPAVLDQGSLGSCTANALAGLLQYEAMQDGRDFGVPSRLFIYYLERLREGSVNEDAGAYGRDGFAALRKTGAPPETLWPYDINLFRQAPPQDAYDAAGENRIHHYTHARQNIREIQHLIMLRRPVAFGFTVFESFEGEQCMRTGLMPMPLHGERVLGGHEVYAMGWKTIDLPAVDEGQDFAEGPEILIECRNSWGTGVMDEGNFWMPAKFAFGGYASDFRAIQN